MHLLDSGSEDQIESKEVMKDDIVSGIDELGIFLISKKYKSLWLGSNLSIGKARKMAKHNSATSLQVTSSIVAGMKWAEKNSESGVLESENLDWEYIYDFVEPYWQPIIIQETDWRPSRNDTLQFHNFTISEYTQKTDKTMEAKPHERNKNNKVQNHPPFDSGCCSGTGKFPIP